MNIVIVGLGLMGASLAYALRGFRSARIMGVDINPEVCAAALERGAVDKIVDIQRGSELADLLIFAVYAHNIPPLLALCKFKDNAVITDICGVKSRLYSEIEAIIPQNTHYVGIHPMAGKERDGIDNAEAAIFRGTGFIITPLCNYTKENIEFMRDLARHIGASRVTLCEPSKHDEIIAYTSDLCHISATALCMNPHKDFTLAYAAGAFRDGTRVADINAPAWSELILDNRLNVLKQLDLHIENLSKIRSAVNAGDSNALTEILQKSGDNKRELLKLG